MVETSVIVLNYKQAELSIACTKSVLKSKGYNDYEVLLVDNGSRDGSLEKFFTAFRKHPKVRVFETGENTGYTGGNNFAFRHARATKYVIVLNNDTIVEPDWLREMAAAMKLNPDAAAASAHLANVPTFQPAALREARKFFRRRQEKGVTLNPLGYTIEYPARDAGARFSPVVAVHGGGFIFRRELGPPFDNDYFIYAEETKFSWLTRIRGLRILWARNAHVYHLSNIVKKSNPALAKRFTFLGERNKVLNWLTLYQAGTTWKLLPVYLLGILALNAYEPRKIPYRLKAYAWLLAHPGIICRKRREVNALRKVPDRELFRMMSSKLQDDKDARGASGALVKAMNAFSQAWMALMGLPSVERRP
jgi:GT2 family glycosyltransferase